MSTRIRPVRPGESDDPELNQLLRDGKEGWWQDPEMFGVIARRPGLLKAIVPVFVEFFGKGIVEPYLLEMMRIKTGEVNRCTYWSTVRTAAVRGEVEPKEVCIIGHVDETGLTPREAVAIRLAEHVARDPHEVDDAFFAEVRKHFSDEEIVELVFATSIFNWGNKFNITMRMDAAPDGTYKPGLEY